MSSEPEPTNPLGEFRHDQEALTPHQSARTPSRRRLRPELLVLIGALLLAAGVAVGLAVTSAGAGRTGELKLDVAISQHRTAALTAIARAVDVGFGPVVAPALLVTTCTILWFRSQFAAVTVAGLTPIGWLSVEVGKAVVDRPRPPAGTVHALVSETAADSYPSGHTAFAAAVIFAAGAAMLLAQRRPAVVWWIGVPVVMVVGASRLYLGVHYLTDVTASPIFAAGAMLIGIALGGPALLRLREGDHRRQSG